MCRLTLILLVFANIVLASHASQIVDEFCVVDNTCNENKVFEEYKISYERKSNKLHNHTHQHKLAIVVPFRDRFEELLNFIPQISDYLHKKQIKFEIYIVNQIDSFRFNRAALINAGFLESMINCDYMAMHDVDLIPLNAELNYDYPIEGPYHVASPDLHPNYNYQNYIGGILIINKKHYLKVNGMSNKFWGWGREDDEFFMRLNDANLKIRRADKAKIKTDSTNTFRHEHSQIKRKRDTYKNDKQRNDAFSRDNDTGLDTIQYRVTGRAVLNIRTYNCNILNVELFCDKAFTPWCEYQYEFL